MRGKITRRQIELLYTLDRLHRETGLTPTFRELASAEGVCVNAIVQVLQRLQDAGLVSWLPGKSRTLKWRHPAAVVGEVG